MASETSSPQSVLLGLVRAVDACTAGTRAVERSVDQLRTSIDAHHASSREAHGALLVRVEAIEAQVKRCEDRADQERTASFEAQREARGLVARAASAVWNSPEVRLLLTTAVLAVAAYLGVQGAIAPLVGHSP